MKYDFKIRILDNKRSCLKVKEINKFESEITDPENSLICLEKNVRQIMEEGFQDMQAEGFSLVKGQFDV